jgi:hypothetical protein
MGVESEVNEKSSCVNLEICGKEHAKISKRLQLQHSHILRCQCDDVSGEAVDIFIFLGKAGKFL